MALAFDALTKSGAFTTDSAFNHTPVGTPRAVVVFVNQQAQATDQIVGITYGGVAMTRVPTNGFGALSGFGALYCYTLGASIPTGVQSVAVDYSGSVGNAVAFCVSLTGAANMQVAASNMLSNASLDDPSLTLATTSGFSGFVVVGLYSGRDDPLNATVGSGYTKFATQQDWGPTIVTGEYGAKTGASVVANFTTDAADSTVMIAVALEETGAAPGTARWMTTLGVG